MSIEQMVRARNRASRLADERGDRGDESAGARPPPPSPTALQFIEAGVAASITAFYPVLTILVASRFHGERLTWRLMLGSLVAVAGVLVLFLR